MSNNCNDRSSSQNILCNHLSPCLTASRFQIDASIQTEGLAQQRVYECFFETLKHPTIIIDMSLNFIKAKPHLLNNAASSLIKSCNKDFYQGSLLEKFDGSLSDFISSMKSKMPQQISYSDMIRIPTAPGSKSIFGLTAAAFDVDHEVRVLGIMLIEVSKTVEEELTAVESFKTSLISALSHELNNPMNSLIPTLEMMSGSYSHQTNEELREMALSNVYILQHKIKDLLDYANMGMNDIKLNMTEFCLNDLFDEVRKLFKLETEHKSNLFIVTIKAYSSRKLTILADRDRLKQVLIKLVSNANKFTHKGVITLTAEENKQNFNVLFIVEDTGIGISKEKQELIFASLSQKNKKYSEFVKLPGLGLEIAKGLCRCMDGKLKVASEEGKGSKFSFEIPTCRISNFDELIPVCYTEEVSTSRNAIANNMDLPRHSSNYFIKK